MLIEAPGSLEDRWRGVFQELGAPRALLACAFTFHARFFAGLLKDFQEAAFQCQNSWQSSWSGVPIDVVCDLLNYKGHHLGYNVTPPPDSKRLFHPKLLIALFGDEVVWSGGSLNLTPAGWRHNREVVIFHRPGDKTLPRELRELLTWLGTVRAARVIVEATRDQPDTKLQARFLTSLKSPIGERFLSHGPKKNQVEEIHLAAPFFEKGESEGRPLDRQWLQTLSRRYQGAELHLYLPQLSGEHEPIRVQGSRATFQKLSIDKIVIHPVARKRGALHGKCACLVYRKNLTRHAFILAGSPNMTSAALMAPPGQGNIESAWVFGTTWERAKTLFSHLGSQCCSLDELEFTAPEMSHRKTWMPLRHARFDPFENKLTVEWRSPSDAGKTVLLYVGKPIAVDHQGSCGISLEEGVAWLVTRNKRGGFADGCFPLDIPVELLRACQDAAPERSPEDWLSMLGESEPDVLIYSPSSGTRRPAVKTKIEVGQFAWSERVRTLADKMRFLHESAVSVASREANVEWLRRLIDKIYETHDPNNTVSGHECVWRAWVRLELWYAALTLSRTIRARRDKADWRARAETYKKGLRLKKVPPAVSKQLHAVMNAMK